MTRILLISHGHPTFSIGGAEAASHNLFSGLNRQPGVEAYFLARVTQPLVPHRQTPLMSLRQGARETFLWTEDYDEVFLSNRSMNDLSGAFRRYLLEIKPEIVHFHHFIGLGVEALWEVRRTLPDAMIAVTFHEFLPICLHHGQMVKNQNKRLCRRATPADCHACFPERSPAQLFERELFIKSHLEIADAFISPSRFLIDRYVEWGLPREKFALLENGIGMAEPAPVRALPPGGRRSRFGFFGQITEFKGLHILLDAVGRVSEKSWGDDAALCIFGGNLENQPAAFRQSFDALMAAAGRRAKFYGSYGADDMPDLMRQVDWVVVPSIWWENSPLVIQESFRHGRPLLVSDIGGMKEKIADGVNGLQFRVGSAEDLADKITLLLEDPSVWERLRAGVPQPIDQNEAARQHLEFYRQLGSRAGQKAAAGAPPLDRLAEGRAA